MSDWKQNCAFSDGVSQAYPLQRSILVADGLRRQQNGADETPAGATEELHGGVDKGGQTDCTEQFQQNSGPFRHEILRSEKRVTPKA
jgi:hypothetical protein